MPASHHASEAARATVLGRVRECARRSTASEPDTRRTDAHRANTHTQPKEVGAANETRPCSSEWALGFAKHIFSEMHSVAKPTGPTAYGFAGIRYTRTYTFCFKSKMQVCEMF